IGIAMNHAGNRAVRLVADRIAMFLCMRFELALVGNKLPRNRIVRVRGVDQIGKRWRDRHRITRRDLLQAGKPLRLYDLRFDKFGCATQGFVSCRHGRTSFSPIAVRLTPYVSWRQSDALSTATDRRAVSRAPDRSAARRSPA